MSIRQVAFGALIIIALLIAYEIGRHRPPFVSPSTGKVWPVSVSTAGNDKTKCWVRPPVLLLQAGVQDKIQWSSTDNAYCISFVNLSSAPQGYKGKSPLHGGDSKVCFEKGKQSKSYDVDYDPSQRYYYYETFDKDGNVCKRADNDHDTGLDVEE